MLRTLRLIPALALLLAPAVAQAQTALPAARDLVSRHVAAIGGRDAILARASLRTVGTFEMPAAGLKGDLTVVQSKDGRTAMKIVVPGMGELAGGYDGTTAWSMNPMQGARILEGRELTQMTEDAGFLTLLRESPAIASMETVEKTTLGGVACYKVKVTYTSGRVSHDCYAVDSGLMAGTITAQESAMGTLEITNLMSDWKEFGGVKFATTLRQQAMGQEQVMSIASVEFDNADDAKMFELPPAVKAIAAPKKP